MSRTAAVFFDVDFTLIHPGPRFQSTGYTENCERHGIAVDAAQFDAAVAGAAAILEASGYVYDEQLFIGYTCRIIELMGGSGPAVAIVAREIYDDWARNHHFVLYDDVTETLRGLRTRGVRAGLISNAHRKLDEFQTHFALDGLIDVSVSSEEHGFMKPHPSIFQLALDRMQVAAEDAVMVGDSLTHDVRGAMKVGMRAVWLDRAGRAKQPSRVPVIRSLRELGDLL